MFSPSNTDTDTSRGTVGPACTRSSPAPCETHFPFLFLVTRSARKKKKNLLAAASDGVRRDRHHLPPDPLPVHVAAAAPLLCPRRRRLRLRLQSARRRGGGRCPEGVQAGVGRRKRGAPRAHQPRAVRAIPLALLQGRGHGAGDERRDGERLDDWLRNGRPADRRRRGPPRGLDAAVVALHEVPAAADAGRLHLQRLRAAHHPRHQPARIHRRHRLRSVLRLQRVPQAGGQPEPVPRDEVLCRAGFPLRRGRPIQLPGQGRGWRQHLSGSLIGVPGMTTLCSVLAQLAVCE